MEAVFELDLVRLVVQARIAPVEVVALACIFAPARNAALVRNAALAWFEEKRRLQSQTSHC